MNKNLDSLENVVSLMFSLGRNIREHGIREETPTNPSLIKLEIMKFVSLGNKSMKDVSEYLCVKAPTATAFTDDLVKNKLIVREPDKKDRRTIKLSLTKLGSKILKDKYSSRGQPFREVLNSLSGSDLINLEAVLIKLQNIYKIKNQTK